MVHILDFAPFAPAAPRPRSDGWTPATQQWFIAALAVGGSVRDACRHVGRSRDSAYRLRQRADAAAFAAAWDEATSRTEDELVDAAVERCVDGRQVKVFYRGVAVGDQIEYDNRLLMFMLRRRELSNSRRSRERPDTTGKTREGLAQDSRCV